MDASQRKIEVFRQLIRDKLQFSPQPSSSDEDVRQQLLEAIERNSNLVHIVEVGSHKIELLEATTVKLQEEGSVQRKQIGDLLAKVDSLTGKCDMLEDRSRKLREENTRLKKLDSVQLMEKENLVGSLELGKVRKQLHAAGESLTQKNQVIEKLEQEKKLLAIECERTRTSFAGLSVRLEQETSRSAAQTAELVDSRNTIEKQRKRIESLDAEMKRLRSEYDQVQRDLLAKYGAIERSVSQEREKATEQIRHMSATRVRLQLQVAKLHGKLIRTKSPQQVDARGAMFISDTVPTKRSASVGSSRLMAREEETQPSAASILQRMQAQTLGSPPSTRVKRTTRAVELDNQVDIRSPIAVAWEAHPSDADGSSDVGSGVEIPPDQEVDALQRTPVPAPFSVSGPMTTPVVGPLYTLQQLAEASPSQLASPIAPRNQQLHIHMPLSQSLPAEGGFLRKLSPSRARPVLAVRSVLPQAPVGSAGLSFRRSSVVKSSDSSHNSSVTSSLGSPKLSTNVEEEQGEACLDL